MRPIDTFCVMELSKTRELQYTVRKIRFLVLYILKLYDKIGKILRLMH